MNKNKKQERDFKRIFLRKKQGTPQDVFLLEEIFALDESVDKKIEDLSAEIKTIKEAPQAPTVKGDPPSDHHLVALIKPLIPVVENGKTPTAQELLAIIKPLIPKVENGKTPTNEQLLQIIKPLIPSIPEPVVIENNTETKIENPVSGKEIVDKINSLDTESEHQIDASHIKNLPKATGGEGRNVGGHGAYYTLSDVNMAGILAGQSVQWDGIQWIPFTPAGSGGTPVWGEDLTVQGVGTSFTLAHTPIAGTVRLFRGGAYQSVANNDYSVSGATITLTSALQEEEVLVADYSY